MSSLSTAVYSNPDTPIWLKADLLKGIPELKLYASGYNPAPSPENPYYSYMYTNIFAPSDTLGKNGNPTIDSYPFYLDGSQIGQNYPPYDPYPTSPFNETRQGYWTMSFSGSVVSADTTNTTFGNIWGVFSTDPLDSRAGPFISVSAPMPVLVPTSPDGTQIATPYNFQAYFLNVPGQNYWFKICATAQQGVGGDKNVPSYYIVNGVMIYFTPTGTAINPSAPF